MNKTEKKKIRELVSKTNAKLNVIAAYINEKDINIENYHSNSERAFELTIECLDLLSPWMCDQELWNGDE